MARCGAMWRSASKSKNEPPSARFVVLGPPADRRVALFQQALTGLGHPAACVIPYAELLSGRVALWDLVQPGTILRVESPGKDFETERMLIAAGAGAAEAEGCERISAKAAINLPFERGRLRYTRQWYLGLCAALQLVAAQLEQCPSRGAMSAPGEIAVMFDKRACHERLSRHDIAVPPALGPVHSFDELMSRMEQTGYRRVFVKLAHGSSASGAVAYQTQGTRHLAITTVEMVCHDGEVQLYNSRRMRAYREPHEIATLIDALCRQRVQVEQWLPKAGIDGCAFDLRLVVIAGQARHIVARLSRSPMTNLHLLNARGDVTAITARMGPMAWAAALHTCERAMACFPSSLYAGIDLLVTPDFRHHAVLEVNAFGDLLPGLLSHGVDTYTAEVLAMGDTRAIADKRVGTGTTAPCLVHYGDTAAVPAVAAHGTLPFPPGESM